MCCQAFLNNGASINNIVKKLWFDDTHTLWMTPFLRKVNISQCRLCLEFWQRSLWIIIGFLQSFLALRYILVCWYKATDIHLANKLYDYITVLYNNLIAVHSTSVVMNFVRISTIAIKDKTIVIAKCFLYKYLLILISRIVGEIWQIFFFFLNL